MCSTVSVILTERGKFVALFPSFLQSEGNPFHCFRHSYIAKELCCILSVILTEQKKSVALFPSFLQS